MMRLEAVGAANMQANSFKIEPFSTHWQGKGEWSRGGKEKRREEKRVYLARGAVPSAG